MAGSPRKDFRLDHMVRNVKKKRKQHCALFLQLREEVNLMKKPVRRSPPAAKNKRPIGALIEHHESLGRSTMSASDKEIYRARGG